jgi:hypothetical protein
LATGKPLINGKVQLKLNSISHGLLTQEPPQLAKVEGFCQVVIEPRVKPRAKIVVGIERRQGDRIDVGIELLRYERDIQAITIRQTAIAQEGMETAAAEQCHSFSDGFGGHRRVTAARQKRREHVPGVLVILDQKNLHIL